MIVRNVPKPGSFRKTDNDSGVEYEYSRLLITNRASDNEETVASALPRRGSRFAYRGQAKECTGVEISKGEALAGGKQQWEARISFVPAADSLALKKPTSTSPSTNPLFFPAEIEWRDKTIEWVSPNNVDINGKPYVNSAGDKFKDIPPTEISHAILTIARYEASYNPSAMMQFANTINSSLWFGCPTKTAKCFFPCGKREWIEALKTFLWKVTYTFEIAPETWTLNIADFGKRRMEKKKFVDSRGYASETGEKIKVPCLDELGQPYEDGEFLDGHGGQLSEEKKKKGQIFPIPFERYKLMDLNRLRLP